MVRLARTFYGIPKSKPESFDKLLRLWRYVPESLRVELRHIPVPAFRNRTAIFKNDTLIQEMEEFIADFEGKNQEDEATI